MLLYYFILEMMRFGEYKPFPEGIMTVDVLLPKFRLLLGYRMLHTAYMLSLAGYLQSLCPS